MTRIRRSAVLSLVGTGIFLAAVGAVSCMSGAPMPVPGDGGSGDGDQGGGDGMVSFAGQIQPIFDARCTVCHQAGGLADILGITLRLVPGESYNGLVNQPSSQRADLTRVVPGDSTSSLLFLKVSSNTPPVGSRMPLFGAALSQAEIDLIRDWIDQGAQDN